MRMTDGCASVVKQIVNFVLIINGIVEIQHQSPANSNHFFFPLTRTIFFFQLTRRIFFRELESLFVPTGSSSQRVRTYLWMHARSRNSKRCNECKHKRFLPTMTKISPHLIFPALFFSYSPSCPFVNII